MLVLKVLSEKNKEIRVSQETFTIGRSPECDYRLEDSRISRKHARFSEYETGKWLIEDLGSTHKTRVNGRIIESPSRLEAGDLVQMGSFAVEVELASGGVPSPAEAGHAQETFGSTASITYPAEELRTRWLQSPPKNEIWQRLHRVHVNHLLDIAQSLNLALSVEEIFSKVRQAVFHNLQCIDRLALLVDRKSTGELCLLQVGSRRPNSVTISDDSWISRTIARRVFVERLAIQSPDARHDVRFGWQSSIIQKEIGAVLAVPLWNEDQVVGVLYADGKRSTTDWAEEGENDLGFFSALGNLVATSVQRWLLAQDLKIQQELRLRLERYHSPSVIRQLLEAHRDGDGQLPPRFSEVSVLFADIVGFTGLAESLPPERIASLLNRFFAEMTELVFAEGGTLDKFVGDSVMAFFGAPEPQADHADRAVRVARNMLERVSLLNCQDAFEEEVRIRVSVSSGRAVVGDVGSPKRMDFTVLGSNVNLASRIEEICPPNYCFVSEATFQRLESQEGWQDFGLHRLRGITDPVRIFGTTSDGEDHSRK